MTRVPARLPDTRDTLEVGFYTQPTSRRTTRRYSNPSRHPFGRIVGVEYPDRLYGEPADSVRSMTIPVDWAELLKSFLTTHVEVRRSLREIALRKPNVFGVPDTNCFGFADYMSGGTGDESGNVPDTLVATGVIRAPSETQFGECIAFGFQSTSPDDCLEDMRNLVVPRFNSAYHAAIALGTAAEPGDIIHVTAYNGVFALDTMNHYRENGLREDRRGDDLQWYAQARPETT